jgi:hypothetical protein
MIHRIYAITHCCTVRVTRRGVEYFSALDNFCAGRVGYLSGAW